MSLNEISDPQAPQVWEWSGAERVKPRSAVAGSAEAPKPLTTIQAPDRRAGLGSWQSVQRLPPPL